MKKQFHYVTIQLVLLSIIALFIAMPMTLATELGVNYYHESLMTAEGYKYIPRTEDGVHSDLEHIKQISNYVKIYVNPFVDANIDWVETIIHIGHEKDLHMSLSMMVDDRDLTHQNWQDYSSRVVNICSRFNGVADEIVIGNEITLHSPMSRTEIRDKVIALINDCEAVYDGEALYQEFWWAKDVWAGYDQPIYLMMYENWNSFEDNMNQLQSFFGQNGLIGEWGEDLLEDSIVHNEDWQRMEVERRWNLIENKNVPIAYVFSYREPSFTGFGLISPDGRERPAWEFLKTLGQGGGISDGHSDGHDTGSDSGDSGDNDGGTSDNSGSQDNSQNDNSHSGSGLLIELPVTCTTQNGGCSVVSDIDMGSCRSVSLNSNNGPAKVLVCNKDSGYAEIYRQQAPSGNFEICVGAGCVNQHEGFDRFLLSEGNTGNNDGASDDENSGNQNDDSYTDIASASISCEVAGVPCTKQSDTLYGDCRTIEWSSNHGAVKVLSCDKNGQVETYRKQMPNAGFTACVAEACVDNWAGFGSFTY